MIEDFLNKLHPNFCEGYEYEHDDRIAYREFIIDKEEVCYCTLCLFMHIILWIINPLVTKE